MKNLIFTLFLMHSVFSFSQYGTWMTYEHTQFNRYVHEYAEYDVDFNAITPIVRYLLYQDTTMVTYNIDTINFRNVVRLVLSGDSSQYVRGDGSMASFHISTGKDTISGVSAMTSYVVSHNYGYAPVITLTPRSADAAADCYISAIDSNSFTITFTNQPPVGTDNIIFDWVAIKP